MGKSLIIKGADFSANGIKSIPIGTYTDNADVNLGFRRIFIDASGFPGGADYFWANYIIGVWKCRPTAVGIRMRKASDLSMTDYMLWSTNPTEIATGVVSGTVAGVYFYYEADTSHIIDLEDAPARAVHLTADATNPEYDPRT